MNNELLGNKKNAIVSTFLVLLVLGAVFLGAKTVVEIKRIGIVDRTAGIQNTITVSGKGEHFVKPDLAEVTFDITQDAQTVVAAQKVVNERIDAIMKFLKEKNIADADIQTIGYNVYPQYEYQKSSCVYNYCPPEGQRALIGYTVSQSTRLKVRDLDQATVILNQLGALKVTNLSGLNFTTENPDAPTEIARGKAIEDAQKKAKILAKQLGVRLGRVVTYNEGGMYPIYYGKTEAAMGMGGDAQAAPGGSVSVGENKIISTVSVTYELK